MTITILPARLANQIAAGEVVERPASVIKELIENSLDAGATAIHVEVEKGGIKKIKITDNGRGIIKEELTLALSRHATSKIKSLSDLEAIDSLGFRGEALASISSVARLTLTSKPKEQENAWQANAEGREMSVTIKPAAHPNGTSIEVTDLFFNTPARRKFLRTEKTEFTHIDEVVRRIALAHFNVSFTLVHNGKILRQYRLASNKAQYAKRVAMVCGQKFIDHAIEVDCQHDTMCLTGWLGKPSFSRNQNDLCYSYVNGRMMRDKLINHAIRQAYTDILPNDTYPAFVLFLQLDHREVDVNVHPAKHEVRFHQSRYVHDFIFSVCNKALHTELSRQSDEMTTDNAMHLSPEISYAQSEQPQTHDRLTDRKAADFTAQNTQYKQQADYIKPLAYLNDALSPSKNTTSANTAKFTHAKISPAAAHNYQQLMSPLNQQEISASENRVNESSQQISTEISERFFISIEAPGYALFKHEQGLRVLSLFKFARTLNYAIVEQSWQQEPLGLISQPLLLPVIVLMSEQQIRFISKQQAILSKAGISFTVQDKCRVQIRQFPAILRDKDINNSFITLIDALQQCLDAQAQGLISPQDCYIALANALAEEEYCLETAETLLLSAKKHFKVQLSKQLLLNSVPLDLTSHIKQLNS